MTGATTSLQLSSLTENQKAALIKLLTDEDLAIYHAVRSKILSYGQSAMPWLRPNILSSDPVLRRRSTEILQYLARQHADNVFLGFCLRHGEDLDIEEGALSLARTQYPDINTGAYQALLDSYAGDLREEIDFGSSAENIIATINQYLFKKQGYRGNEKNYYEPDNSYLNRVIDRRMGNPLSLCLLYLFLAKRLALPIAGIGMPGHFVCRFQTPTEQIFIDAFNGGKLLSKADCVKYLSQTRALKESDLASDLSPTSPRRMLLRVCLNLHQIYEQLSLAEETNRFQRYIVALAK